MLQHDTHLPVRNSQPENSVLVLLKYCKEQGFENGLFDRERTLVCDRRTTEWHRVERLMLKLNEYSGCYDSSW